MKRHFLFLFWVLSFPLFAQSSLLGTWNAQSFQQGTKTAKVKGKEFLVLREDHSFSLQEKILQIKLSVDTRSNASIVKKQKVKTLPSLISGTYTVVGDTLKLSGNSFSRMYRFKVNDPSLLLYQYFKGQDSALVIMYKRDR